MERYQELFLELPLPPSPAPSAKVEVGEKVERPENEFEVDMVIKPFEISI